MPHVTTACNSVLQTGARGKTFVDLGAIELHLRAGVYLGKVAEYADEGVATSGFDAMFLAESSLEIPWYVRPIIERDYEEDLASLHSSVTLTRPSTTHKSPGRHLTLHCQGSHKSCRYELQN